MFYLLWLRSEDRSEWGLDDQHGFRLVLPTGKSQLYTFDDLRALTDMPDAAIAITAFDASAVVNELLCKLHKELRLFRHFGGIAMEALNSKVNLLVEMKKDNVTWNEELVVPYTREGGADETYRWLLFLREVRVSLLNSSNKTLRYDSAVAKLDEAWRLAEEFYSVEQPVLKMLQVCFPLYLALSSGCGKSDINAVRKAIRENIEFTQNLDSIGRNVATLSEFFEWEDPSGLLDKPAFDAEFRKLSEFYSKKMEIVLAHLPPASESDPQ